MQFGSFRAVLRRFRHIGQSGHHAFPIDIDSRRNLRTAVQGSRLSRGGARHRGLATPASRRSRPRIWVFALGGAVIVAAGAIVTFYVSPTPAPVRPSTPPSPLSASANSSAPRAAAPTVPNTTGLVGEFAKFQAGL